MVNTIKYVLNGKKKEIYGENSLSPQTLRFPALLLQGESWYQFHVSPSRNIGCAYASYMCVYVYM